MFVCVYIYIHIHTQCVCVCLFVCLFVLVCGCVSKVYEEKVNRANRMRVTDESLFAGCTVSELEVNFVATLSMWSTQQVSPQTRLWSQCEPHCRNFPLLILGRLCERFTVTYSPHLIWLLC